MSNSYQRQHVSKQFSNFQQRRPSPSFPNSGPQKLQNINDPIISTVNTTNSNAGIKVNIGQNTASYSIPSQQLVIDIPEPMFSNFVTRGGNIILRKSSEMTNSSFPVIQKETNLEEQKLTSSSGIQGYGELAEDNSVNLVYSKNYPNIHSYGTEAQGYGAETQTQGYNEAPVQIYDERRNFIAPQAQNKRAVTQLYLPKTKNNMKIAQKYLQQIPEDNKTPPPGYFHNPNPHEQIFVTEQPQVHTNLPEERKVIVQGYSNRSRNDRNINNFLEDKSQDYSAQTQNQIIRENTTLPQGYDNILQDYVAEKKYGPKCQGIKELTVSYDNRAIDQGYGIKIQGYETENKEKRYVNLPQRDENAVQNYEEQTYDNIAQNYGLEKKTSEVKQEYETVRQNYENLLQEYNNTETQGYGGQTQQYTTQIKNNRVVSKGYDLVQGKITPKNNKAIQQNYDNVERGYATIHQKYLTEKKQRTAKQNFVNVPQKYSAEPQDNKTTAREQYDATNDLKYFVQNYDQTSEYDQYEAAVSPAYGVSEGASNDQCYNAEVFDASQQVSRITSKPVPQQVLKLSSRVIPSATFPLKTTPSSNLDVYKTKQYPVDAPKKPLQTIPQQIPIQISQQVPQPALQQAIRQVPQQAPQPVVPQHSKHPSKVTYSDIEPVKINTQKEFVLSDINFSRPLPKVPQKQVPNFIPQPILQSTTTEQTYQNVNIPTSKITLPVKDAPQTFSQVITDYPKVDPSFEAGACPIKAGGTRYQLEEFLEGQKIPMYSKRVLPSFIPQIANSYEGDIPTYNIQQKSAQKVPPPKKRTPLFERITYNKGHEVTKKTLSKRTVLNPINQKQIKPRSLELESVVRPMAYQTIEYDEQQLLPKYTRSRTTDENDIIYNIERSPSQSPSPQKKSFNEFQIESQYHQLYHQPTKHTRPFKVAEQPSKFYYNNSQFITPKLQQYPNQENEIKNKYPDVFPEEAKRQLLSERQESVPYVRYEEIDEPRINVRYRTSNNSPNKINENNKTTLYQAQQINKQKYIQEDQVEEDTDINHDFQKNISYNGKIPIFLRKPQFQQTNRKAVSYRGKVPVNQIRFNQEQEKPALYSKRSAISPQKYHQDIYANTQQQYNQRQLLYNDTSIKEAAYGPAIDDSTQQQQTQTRTLHQINQEKVNYNLQQDYQTDVNAPSYRYVNFQENQYQQVPEENDEDSNISGDVFNKDTERVSFGAEVGDEDYE